MNSISPVLEKKPFDLSKISLIPNLRRMEGSFFQKEFIHSIFSWLRDQYDSRRGVVLSRFRMSVTKTLRKTYINCKLMTKNWKNV
jgi:hypothetical protein